MLWYNKRRASSYEIKEDKEESSPQLCAFEFKPKILKKNVSDLTKTCR